MLATIIVLMTLTGGSYVFLNQKQFGKLPQNSRLERILNSPNYKNGAFKTSALLQILPKMLRIIKL